VIRSQPVSEKSRSSIWLRRLLLIMLISYPIVLHFGVMHDQVRPALGILLGLLLVSGLLILSTGSRYGWLLLGSAFIGGVWIYNYHSDPAPLLRLPPVVINGLLCLLFGYTLLPGKRPLIERFAEIIHGHALDQRTLHYTRGATLGWTLLLAFLTLESLLLGLLADARIWLLFTNYINYLMLLLMFFLEYQLRLRRLPHLEHPGFAGFLLALRRIDWRRLW
jgi:uncharacterized membrane protein